MSNEVDLGNEPVKHLLFILAVPAIVSQLVNALYNMVDRMYIGHIADIGATALTGVGVCFPIIMIVSAFAYLVGMGGAPRASIFMGRGDRKTAEKIPAIYAFKPLKSPPQRASGARLTEWQ